MIDQEFPRDIVAWTRAAALNINVETAVTSSYPLVQYNLQPSAAAKSSAPFRSPTIYIHCFRLQALDSDRWIASFSGSLSTPRPCLKIDDEVGWKLKSTGITPHKGSMTMFGAQQRTTRNTVDLCCSKAASYNGGTRIMEMSSVVRQYCE